MEFKLASPHSCHGFEKQMFASSVEVYVVEFKSVTQTGAFTHSKSCYFPHKK